MKRLWSHTKRFLTVIALTVFLFAIFVPWSERLNASFDHLPLTDQETMDVFVLRKYLCGEETIYRGRLLSDEIERISREEGLTFGWMDDKRLYFIEEVDDLSADCKKSAYFGVDPDGNLSLFNGLPEKKRVIRTFFQLDIEYLESSLPKETIKQLYEGIRISDFKEYNSVLSTFSPYAIEN